MADLISRQMAIDVLIRSKEPVNNGDGTSTITPLTDAVIRKVLNELPSVQERKKGIWLIEIFSGTHFCSCCREYANKDIYAEEILSPYCPNCGAELEGVEGAEE